MAMVHTDTISADTVFMNRALELAQQAALRDEVPVGAVVVHEGVIIGEGANGPIHLCDGTAHAEILALRSACQKMGNYRLAGSSLYCTLEPCPMCAGAIIHARISRLVFAAADPKTGAVGSVVHLFADARLNHHTRVDSGCLAPQSAKLLEDFFRARRSRSRS